MTPTRRLAAILAADIAGYSAAMERDEEGTAAAVRALRREVIEPKLAEHRGRLIKTTGDGFLAEFASPLAALKCALAIQKRPDPGGLQLRIGLNLGDVLIEEGGDLLGEGVNIAARLEALAEPGGILVSDKIVREVEGKVETTFEDRGEQQVKNISKPVRVYAVHAAAERGSTAPSYVTAPLALPDKPSIAVLPFQNMSGDVEQEYFADGIVEDIITALSRNKGLFVIARNSSFSYKGKSPDVRQVGRELGVRYVLEGSIRKSGKQVRITGQLIEAAKGTHIWADKFDGDLTDIFDLQDLVTGKVIGSIAPELERAEIARSRQKPTASLEAYDYYLRALSTTYGFTKEGNLQAYELAMTAARADPSFAMAFALAANSYVQRRAFGWSASYVEDERDARALVGRALELDDDNPQILAMAGQVHAFLLREVEYGASLLDRAIALDGNFASARYWAGGAHMWLGKLDVATAHYGHALRVSPRDPRIFLAQVGMAMISLLNGAYEEGLTWARATVAQRPNFPNGHRAMAACLAMLGKIDEARAASAEAERFNSRISLIRDAPWRQLEHIERITEALRRAGMRE